MYIINVVLIFQLPHFHALQELQGGWSTVVGCHRNFNYIYVQIYSGNVTK
jgi:hypothetical protein